MAKTMRITATADSQLKKLEKLMGLSKQKIVEKALKKLAREELFKRADQAYDTLRADTKAWAEEQKERDLWDTTLSDGLKDYE